MRACLIALFLFLLPVLPVEASCELSSARFGNVLLKIGDAERKVLRHEPDRVIQLENRRGGAAGLRYDFYLRHKTIQVYVRGGRISRICHIND